MARYGAPVAVVAVIAAGTALPKLSGAAVPPGLAQISAQQLLSDVFTAKVPQLSGSLTWTANLGLSDLSSLEQELGANGSSSSSSNGGQGGSTGGFDPVSLLSGSYQLNVWLGGTSAEHLALIEGPASELDLVRNGNQAWLWDSTTQTVTHYVAPPEAAAGSTSSGGAGGTTSSPAPNGAPLTPQQLAQKLLDKSSSTTSVTLAQPVYVSGQPAYQLLVAPKNAPGSTVNQVAVDVGAQGPLQGVVLQVAVYAQGTSAPALQLGFTGPMSLGAPPASELTFTPPPGSQVVTRDLGGAGLGGHGSSASEPLTGPVTSSSPVTNAGTVTSSGTGRPSTIGQGWSTVLTGTSASLFGTLQQGELSALTSVVQVNGQQARLFSTNLINVLFMPDGTYYAGLVTPGVLESAASSNS